jgi:restriction endonuclease
MQSLPYEIVEAMIQCFGRCFHYKDVMASFLLSTGVERATCDKHRGEYKFTWARLLLTELGQSEEGILTQQRILTELCKLKDVPDPNVPDRDAALDALRKLKQLAVEHDFVAREQRKKGSNSKRLAEEKERIVSGRAKKLDQLRNQFTAGLTSTDRQGTGYSLEDLLGELFSLFEIEYRKSYRTETQQIDGHFEFQGFDYLVEARWRSDKPTVQEIGGFKYKVDHKFESTRGLFVSVPGFREEVVDHFNETGANIVLMDGQDLAFILEGRIDLREALRVKIEKAARKGIVFTSIAVWG